MIDHAFGCNQKVAYARQPSWGRIHYTSAAPACSHNCSVRACSHSIWVGPVARPPPLARPAMHTPRPHTPLAHTPPTASLLLYSLTSAYASLPAAALNLGRSAIDPTATSVAGPLAASPMYLATSAPLTPDTAAAKSAAENLPRAMSCSPMSAATPARPAMDAW